MAQHIWTYLPIPHSNTRLLCSKIGVPLAHGRMIRSDTRTPPRNPEHCLQRHASGELLQTLSAGVRSAHLDLHDGSWSVRNGSRTSVPDTGHPTWAGAECNRFAAQVLAD